MVENKLHIRIGKGIPVLRVIMGDGNAVLPDAFHGKRHKGLPRFK